MRPFQHFFSTLATFCLFLLAGNAPIFAQLTVTLSPTDTAYGFPGGITTVRVQVAPPTDIEPLVLDISLWKNALPAGDSVWVGVWEREGTRWSCPVYALRLDTGTVFLPPLSVAVQKEKEQINLQTPTGILMVIEPFPLGESEEIAPIKDIMAEKPRWSDRISPRARRILLAALLLGLIGFLMWYFSGRKKENRAPLSRKVKQAPDQFALAALNALEAKNYPEKGEYKAFYSELTHILRVFLADAKKVPSLEATSDELIALMKPLGRPDRLIAVATLLTRADLVKFAKGLPPAGYHTEALALVRQFIKELA